ncbi:MAG: hypothetical protein WCA77_01405 [Thermoplasmata archaeon]
MSEDVLETALQALGLPSGEPPKRAIIHGAKGTLISFWVPGDELRPTVRGAWITATEVQFLDTEPLDRFPSTAHKVKGGGGELLDRFIRDGHQFLTLIEDLDEDVADLERRGRDVPVTQLWPLKQRAAAIRLQVDRALIAASECAGVFSDRLPGFEGAYPSVERQYTHLQGLVAATQSSISDLILLRTAVESNQIAETANTLSKTSNRIAALANESNVRMLGITYLALVLALVSAVILFPNTAATILGMPSAGWVPGVVVDLALIFIAVVPLIWVFTRPWVRRMLDDLRSFEGRIGEGIDDLPEISPEQAMKTGSPPKSPAD